MKSTLRHLILTLTALSLAILSGCGGGGGEKATVPAAAGSFKVALLSPGPVSDAGWNAAAYEGLDVATTAATVVAYEPVWAIGTGKVASPEQARDAHRVVRATLDQVVGAGSGSAACILYGGSVNAGNAMTLFAEDDIDGALVGGAALEAAGFWKIVAAAGAV